MKSIFCHHDIELTYVPHFLSVMDSDFCFRALLQNIEWREESYQIYGREVKAPRLMAWYGDHEASYQYSGIIHHPLPWIDPLVEIQQKMATRFALKFNSVLANLYRSGQDSMGWHADNEKELGRNPIIASLSLGEVRRFCLRHTKTREQLEFTLEHGSLLIMEGETQHHWKHAIPKTRRQVSPRVNLTFRQITGTASG